MKQKLADKKIYQLAVYVENTNEIMSIIQSNMENDNDTPQNWI